jgi:hypothetical protein
LFSLPAPAARVALAVLILVELGLTGLIGIRIGRERAVYTAAFTVLLAFLVTSIVLLAAGVENCGCFGTQWVSTPATSIGKNLILLTTVAYLHREHQGGDQQKNV